MGPTRRRRQIKDLQALQTLLAHHFDDVEDVMVKLWESPGEPLQCLEVSASNRDACHHQGIGRGLARQVHYASVSSVAAAAA